MMYLSIMKKIWSEFIGFFIRGLVFIAPIAITILLISFLVNWVKDRFSEYMGPYSGLFIVIGIVLFIAFLGFLGTKFIGKPVESFLDKVLDKIPLVNTIYSSTKDLVNSFFGDNKKFDKPVLVQMDSEGHIEKIGFITQQSLESLGLENKVAVYFPLSYSVAGDLYVISPEKVKPLHVSSSDVMRFLISGGITDPDKHHHVLDSKIKP